MAGFESPQETRMHEAWAEVQRIEAHVTRLEQGKKAYRKPWLRWLGLGTRVTGEDLLDAIAHLRTSQFPRLHHPDVAYDVLDRLQSRVEALPSERTDG